MDCWFNAEGAKVRKTDREPLRWPGLIVSGLVESGQVASGPVASGLAVPRVAFRLVSSLAGAGLLTLCLLGCDDSTRATIKEIGQEILREAVPTQRATDESPVAPTAEPGASANPVKEPLLQDDEQALHVKLDQYVGCVNDASPQIHRSIDRYAQWVSDGGPTGKRTTCVRNVRVESSLPAAM